MAADPNVFVKLTADTSKFVEGMKRLAAMLSPTRPVLPSHLAAAMTWCTEDHETVFLGTEGGLDRPCPGCGAAL